MGARGRLKILIVLYYYHPYVSGLSLLAKALAEGLAARGHAITVLTTKYQPSLPGCEELNGVRVVRANVLARIGKGVVSWEFLRRLFALSKDHDIVNPHLPMAHFGLVAGLIDQKKLVTQYHCDLNLGPGWVGWLLQRFSYWSMNRTLRASSRVIAITNDYFTSSQFSRYAGKVLPIYPPIDHRRFGKVSTAELKMRLAITGNPHVIGFVGRIVEEKGLEYLLEAIPFLQKNLDEFLVLIAGDYENVAGGSVKSRLDGLVARFPGIVKFVGPLNFHDLVAFYNLIDVLVLPSVDPLEAFGMVQLEALYCGTPVVASDMPGVREIVSKTGYGRLANRRDAEDIARKIIELHDCPVVIMPEELDLFDYERSLDLYERLFNEMASARNRI